MGWSVPVAPVAYTPQIATDTTARTVTTAAFNQISGSFSIPANDPDVGSVYILTCWGSATFAVSTSQAHLRPVIFGVNLPSVAPIEGGSGTVSPSFILTFILIVTAVGASGSLNGVGYLTGADANITASGFTLINPTTVNTTLASTFLIQGNFASTTGSPTMTINSSIYERDGPGAVAQ